MPAPIAKKPWTVMVYMAGDNNLDPEGVEDLKEMKKVGSTDKLNIIAQFDRASGHVARRYYLRKGGIVTGDAVASLGGQPGRVDECRLAGPQPLHVHPVNPVVMIARPPLRYTNRSPAE